MTKANVTITVDSNVLELARLNKIVISRICNTALKSYLEIDKGQERSKGQIIKDLEETQAILAAKKQELNDYLTKERIEEEKEKEKIAKFKNMLHRSIRANNPMR